VVAGSWIFTHLEWLRANASKLVVIQVRDGVSEGARRMEKLTDMPPSLVARGLQWLSSPFSGLISSQGASALFRNDNLLGLLAHCFADGGFDKDFFKIVSFEFQGDSEVSLSFYLTEAEKALINESTADQGFKDQVNALLDWWQRPSAPARPDQQGPSGAAGPAPQG
jgi:hypothetical protein